jgi:hypothetical protein
MSFIVAGLSRDLRRLRHLITKQNYIDEFTAEALVDQDFEDWRSSGFPRNALCWKGLPFTPSSLSNRAASNRLPLQRLCISSSIDVLGDNLFQGWASLDLIVFELGSRLTSIPRQCFLNCSSLKSICLPPQVEKVRAESFRYCQSLEWVGIDSVSAMPLIQRQAFHYCIALRSISLPQSLETVCTHCFAECRALELVLIDPDSRLLQLGSWSFWQCSRLRSIYLPRLVEFIGQGAFEGTAISDICVSPENCHFYMWNSFLIASESLSIVRYLGSEQEITIPDFVESMRPGCFRSLRFVTQVIFELPSRVRRLHPGAFAKCSSLTSICIPSSVEAIEAQCFAGCSSLRDVTFAAGSQLLEIGASAFTSCTSLKWICIPESVRDLGDRCFYKCDSMTSFQFHDRPCHPEFSAGEYRANPIYRYFSYLRLIVGFVLCHYFLRFVFARR